ncbi:MAG: EamA family transporter [Rhodospirillales bacterium]|nr:EamA family transporter [Rhodospirillales bacterium]
MSTSAEGRRGFLGSRAEGLALLVFTGCSWGLTWPQSKFLLSLLPPFSMRATCGVAGCAIAFLLAALRREPLVPPRGQWGRLLVFSMLNYGLFILLTAKALSWMSASQTVVLTYTLPIWASIFAWPMLGERPTPLRVLAIVLGLTGVTLLVNLGAPSAGPHELAGAALALAAAMLFGLGTVIAKRKPLGMPPITAVAWQALFGSMPVTLAAFTEAPRYDHMTPLGWAAVAYIAILPMTVSYLAWFRALRLVPASTAATTVLLSPLIGVAGSALLLGETLGPRQVLGLVLTLTGVGLAARR